jgi:hypothetical protein
MIMNALEPDGPVDAPDYEAAYRSLADRPDRTKMLLDDLKAFGGAAKKTHGLATGLDKGLRDAAKPVADGGRKLLEATSEKAKNKLRSEQASLEDEDAAITLKKLMIQDPIISEYDDDQIIEVYNAIRELNPQVALNETLLRTVLREALQYDASIPLHTQKELAGLYDTMTKGRMNQSRMNAG